jgi:uncharacterized protein YrrD
MVRSWFELHGMPVTIPSEGRRVGTVEDFYYKLDTNSIYALRVNTGINGYRLLIASAIQTIGREAVTIESDVMLIRETHAGNITEYPLGSSLLNSIVKSESGTTLGRVSDILIATDPPVALRISDYKLDNGSTFSANAVTDYGGDTIFILDKAARGLG